MRQQEANQFDKGLNLDTNPIAMDNHQLTGALNATMITMNGNELVLLNDMGNGKVDQALLPEGYVPVGMLEYGGIVYVASYNPLIGKSLIGCFPSPQRNFPSIENGTGETQLLALEEFIEDGFIEKLSLKNLLIGNNDIIRPGDKFIITAAADVINYYKTKSNYIKLRVLVVNEEDGSSIDITDDLTTVDANNGDVSFLWNSSLNNIPEDKFSIYGSRISGKIYLESKLVVPSYINTQILANKSNNIVTVTIKPTAYDLPDENGNEVAWNLPDHVVGGVPLESHTYYLHYRKNSELNWSEVNLSFDEGNPQFVISDLSENDTLQYELYPKYSYKYVNNLGSLVVATGKIKSLKRENTIDIGSIGTGDVEFSTFRYYNDMATETFVFDYGLNAYVEGFDGNNITINSIELEVIDVDNLLTNSGTTANSYDSVTKKIIDLGTTNYFGVYTRMIPYSDETLNFGKHYIGRVKVQVAGRELQCSNWYSIITSTLTNKLYLDSSENMIKIQTNENDFNQHIFKFGWESEIEREFVSENSLELVDSGSSTKGILTNRPSSVNLRIKYETLKTGHIRYNHSGSVKIPQSRDTNDASGGKIRFPYSLSKLADLSYTDFDASANIDYSGELNQSITTINNIIESDSDPALNGHNGQVWYERTNNSIIFNYRLWSQFFEKLLKNPNCSGETVDDYKFTVNTQMSAFVPYLTCFNVGNYSQERLESVFGTLANVQYDENRNNIFTSVLPQYWLYYGLDHATYGDDCKNRNDKHIGIVLDTYAHLEGGIDWIVEEENTPKDDYPKWGELSPSIANKMKEKCGFAPPILTWGGVYDSWSPIYPQSGPSDGDTVANANRQIYYNIVMMLDESGNYHVLNQYGKNYQDDLILDIIKSFHNIYVCQPNQLVEFDYWTGDTSSEGYKYTTNYQLTITYKVNISIADHTKPTITNNEKYLKYNLGGDSLSFDNVTLKLPKIELASGSDSQQYTEIVNAPDLSVKISQFLTSSTSPTFDTCAIILDKGGRNIVMNAYKHYTNTNNDDDSNYQPVLFNPNHVYIKNINSFDLLIGNGVKLLDIQDTQNILPGVEFDNSYNTIGSGWIALAIREGKLKVANNTDNDTRMLVIVPSRCNLIKSGNLSSGCVWWLGHSFNHSSSSNRRTGRLKVVDLCGKFVDVNLFTGWTGNASSLNDPRIRKLSESCTSNTHMSYA